MVSKYVCWRGIKSRQYMGKVYSMLTQNNLWILLKSPVSVFVKHWMILFLGIVKWQLFLLILEEITQYRGSLTRDGSVCFFETCDLFPCNEIKLASLYLHLNGQQQHIRT